MNAIEIPDELRAAIYAEARAAFPAECCGYLVGPRSSASAGSLHLGPADGITVTALVRCRNAQPDGEHPTHPERGAETGFVIAGAELLAFANSFRGELPARIVYHSHTNGRAYFSTVDRASAVTAAGPAYPVQHLVIGVTAQGVTEAAQFAWSDEDGDFVEVARWDARC